MKKRCQRVIISTIFEGYAVKHAITKLSPDKLILLVDTPPKREKKKKINSVVESIKDFFKDALNIEIVKIPSYDIPKIMQEVLKIINKESKQGNKIFIHMTEGRKPTSLALLFAAYRMREKVEGAYYITEEKHNLIKLPMLEFDINETKKIFLKEIEKGNGKLKYLQKKAKLKQSAAYQNVQELKKEGYIESDGVLKLTDLGRIMIL